MANEGFEHPCTLYVENGAGMIQLRAVPLTARSAADGTFMRGKVKSVKYFESGSYVEAEASGNLISFPASVLKFVNVGDGVGQILHGSVCLKMECTAGTPAYAGVPGNLYHSDLARYRHNILAAV